MLYIKRKAKIKNMKRSLSIYREILINIEIFIIMKSLSVCNYLALCRVYLPITGIISYKVYVSILVRIL